MRRILITGAWNIRENQISGGALEKNEGVAGVGNLDELKRKEQFVNKTQLYH